MSRVSADVQVVRRLVKWVELWWSHDYGISGAMSNVAEAVSKVTEGV